VSRNQLGTLRLIRLVLAPASEEAPPEKHQDNKAQRRKGTVLLEQQLPVDPHRRTAVLFRIVPQPRADLAHALEAVATVQQILDILGHDLGYVAQLAVELIEVLGCARVGVRGLGALDEGVKLGEGVGPERGRLDIAALVGGGELARQIGEVGEGQFPRVGAVGYAEEDDGEVAVDCVAVWRAMLAT